MKRIVYLGFAIALSTVLGVSTAGAQTQPPAQSPDQNNLGDYARKVRKETTPAKSKPKVYDNDNIPKDDKLSVVGPQAPENAANAAPAEAGQEASAAPGLKTAVSPEEDQAKKQVEWKQWQEKINAQKDQIDLLNRELDVLQREYQLRAAALYADVGNRLRNQAQWDKQDVDYKQKIADKQKAVDEAKQKLDDLQEEARKAGVPAAMREP
ncbi:MAG: hypothetical protein WCA16_13985 [Candidatus Sulfotelmatobacter sp.]